jgi:peptidoglycan glycosyltransferase
MNTSLRRVSLAIMALIVLLLGNATLTQVFTADGLRSDPRNQRVLLDEYARQRGSIISQFDGQVLAGVQATNDKLKF